MEANKHALHTTAHTPNDGSGKGSGLGGGMHSFLKTDFGPGGAKVDTTKPFRVHTHFGASGGSLSSIEVTLEGASGGTVQFSAAPADYLRGAPARWESRLGHTMAATNWIRTVATDGYSCSESMMNRICAGKLKNVATEAHLSSVWQVSPQPSSRA